MQKEELEKIANLSDLKKYKESDEYKSIIKECSENAEKSREKVRELYHKEVKKEQDWDFHDKTYKWIEFLRDILEKIQSDSKWAKALRKEIDWDIAFNDNMMTWYVMDKHNNVYSHVVLNNYDMERLVGTNNRVLPQILDGLINMLEKTKDKVDTEVY